MREESGWSGHVASFMGMNVAYPSPIHGSICRPMLVAID